MASAVSTPAGQSAYRSKLDRILQRTARRTPLQRSTSRRVGPLGSVHRYAGSYLGQSHSIQTPVTARSRPSLSAEQQATDENNLKELKGKTWKIYRVTPLYNFQNKKSDLQHYSRTLSTHIAAEARKGTFVDTSVPDDAVVSQITGLEVGSYDPKALLIEVRGKARNDTVKVISQAVLFSTDLEVNPLKVSLQDKFSYFSSMLIRGPVVHADIIKNWIEVQFDCRVVPQVFTESELGFLTAMCTTMDDNDKPVELVYMIPTDVEGLSTITYSNRLEDCRRLWETIRSSDDGQISYKEASDFIGGLESHFYECFSIKLGAMTLNSVQTAIAKVTRQGQIKFLAKSTDNILKVLRYLTDVALEHLKSF